MDTRAENQQVSERREASSDKAGTIPRFTATKQNIAKQNIAKQNIGSESAVIRLAPPPGRTPGGTAGYRLVKRVLDILGTLLLLLFCFPLMLGIALLIKTTSPGPALFRQRRLGRTGQPFMIVKFRTMSVNAEQQLASRPDLRRQHEETFKLAADPRITGLGRFLRRTSLDELPQVINVLKGSMSVIGPRPIVPQELVKYGDLGEKLLLVKPGLGGLWQVSGRSSTTYAERVRLDMHYIDCCSLWLDFTLLLRTVAAVLTCRGSS